MGRRKASGRKSSPKPKKQEPTFPLAGDLQFAGAQVVDLAVRPVEKGDESKVEATLAMVAVMTPDTAALLEVKPLLYSDKNLPREGFKTVVLDVGRIKPCRLLLKYGDTALDAQPVHVAGWSVKRVGPSLYVRFRALFDGYVQQLSDFVNGNEKQPVSATIVPLQKVLAA